MRKLEMGDVTWASGTWLFGILFQTWFFRAIGIILGLNLNQPLQKSIQKRSGGSKTRQILSQKSMKIIERQRNYFHKNIRLRDYDYSQSGAYFITICTYHRECLFGEISETNGSRNLVLNRFGKIILDEWLRTPAIRHEILLDEFIVMPNHFHAIIIINNAVGAYGHTPLQSHTRLQAPRLRSPSKTVGAPVRGFKSTITRDINQIRHTLYAPVWQRNYYERIIRNDEELNRIREYIQYNPTQWELDRENPERTGISPIEREIWG